MNNQFKKSETALIYLDIKSNLVFYQRPGSDIDLAIQEMQDLARLLGEVA